MIKSKEINVAKKHLRILRIALFLCKIKSTPVLEIRAQTGIGSAQQSLSSAKA